MARFLADHPETLVSTKVGFLAPGTAIDAAHAGVVEHANTAHDLNPAYVHWQMERNRAELGRDILDTVFLHNPEHGAGPDRDAFHAMLLDAFAVLEAEADAGHIRGYGVATWSGFTDGLFSVADLLALADQAAPGAHHLTAVQLPVSLVNLDPITAWLDGRGPIADAARAGLAVLASAPLHGGELPPLVNDELAAYIRPGLTPARAALHAVMSCPDISHVLLSASTAEHWREAADTLDLPPLPTEHLRKVAHVLAAE
ncbi:aldo/keto reductase [Uniformispora flossi]|uniref:aldo/keto reductase n=1 Tax=Uniformispora flossi TaxID=3390723 RepID=UPI003C2E936F